MPDDAMKVWPNTGLQPSVNLHAPDTAFMFSCSGTDVLPRRDEGLGMPYAVDQTT